MIKAGWIFMIVSWGVILGLCVFCFRFIFAKHAEEHLTAPMEIEVELEEEAREEDDLRSSPPDC